MKKLILALTMMISVGANAAIDCNQVSAFAEEVMTARQSGVPMSRVIEILNDNSLNSIAIDAYKKPRYQTDEYKQRAITEFGNKAVIECLMITKSK